MERRKVEVFAADCAICEEAVTQIQALDCEDCEVTVIDMSKGQADECCTTKAAEYGITSLPAVAVDGELLSCCVRHEFSADAIKEAAC
ncbi:glutaredoxin [Indiicoccus explosivorum]|uniref:glutaredoxin n=1 Tax=Indiicoccus explosivorum TaxID=1917864 RepID=UPI000B44B513|nr:glutaredoxin [Indiicoccus explosivorum]